MTSISRLWQRIKGSAFDMVDDCRGIAAVEFVVIVPIMLVMFFGTVEFSSGVTIYRKTTLVTRTLSDLTSQSTGVDDADLIGFFNASSYILAPYSAAPGFPATSATITELYINPLTLQARVQWSRSATITTSGSTSTVVLGTGRTVSSVVTIPSQLMTAGTYVIYSEVTQPYKPTIGYVMAPAGVNLSDVAYTRPRQSACVLYSASAEPASGTSCPTL
jgi:Flp pilus assembly protein TadG